MKHEAPQGSEAHTHENGQVHVHDDRDHPHAPLPLNPQAAVPGGGPSPADLAPAPTIVPMGIDPVIVQGQGEWFARELLGGWVALADARGIPREDFLAERCALMLVRLSTIESQLIIATTTVQALSTENETLHRKIDDCGCQDEEASKASPA